MACINMFNPDHQGLCGAAPPMSPRISFSNDFVVDPPPPSAPRHERPSDPDFEFSVGSRPMIAADELFFKGRMLPLRGDNCNAQLHKVTLRDELRAQDDDGNGWDAARPPKGSSIRWKELLGLKKGHCAVAKRNDRELAEGSGGKSTQELSDDGGARAKDVEMGL